MSPTVSRPRVRSRVVLLAWLVPLVVVVVVAAVIGARLLRTTTGFLDFEATYPGTAPLWAGTPAGIPAWLAWQHGLNALFMLLIFRSVWIIRTSRKPTGWWTPRGRRRGGGLRLAVPTWFHLSADILWLANGLVFYVLLFSTGQWKRLVPADWTILPRAVTTAVQYVSFDWPHDDGWIDYNALQSLTYFGIVFLAAPVAILTGLRLSPLVAGRRPRLERLLPLGVARRAHIVTMIVFLAFVVVHVVLVLGTGALRNLNHMYAGRDDEGWIGVIVFAATSAVLMAAWVLLRPTVVRLLAGLTGDVRR